MGFSVKKTDFVGGFNILASEHFQYVEAGVTLDASEFGATTIEVGTLLARVAATGKFVEFDAADVDNYDDYGILNVDVAIDGEEDEIVGEVLVRASVYEAKLPENASLDAFKALVPNIRFVTHVKE